MHVVTDVIDVRYNCDKCLNKANKGGECGLVVRALHL